MTLQILLLSAKPVLLMMVTLWLWSVVRKNASVVDPWWSMGFLAITLTLGSQMPKTPGRCLLAVLVAVWALRLWAYLLYRNWGTGEDSRYQAFREKYGPERYWWISFFQVFMLQGVLMLIISAPLQVAITKPTPDPVTLFDLLGAALVLVGLSFEAIADAQMAEFRNNSGHEGKVMNSGLWRYSRHPNYFGEALLWWGFWVSALDTPWGFCTIFAPILMTFLLLKVSGVTMLEDSLKDRKPKYADYIKKTSAFIPWPPKEDIEE